MSFRVIIIFLACAGLALPGPPALADDPPAGLMTQEETVRLALEGNLDLRASTERMAGIRQRIRQAREFPATSIEFDFDQQVDLFDSGEQYVGFTQEIEFPTRIGLRVDAAREDVRGAEAEHRLAGWETALAAKLLYQELALARKLVALSRENMAIAQRLEEMAGEKYELGIVGKLEVMRAGVEAATAANDLSRMEKLELAARMRLNHLLGRAPEDSLATTPLTRGRLEASNLQSLIALALEQRLELKVLDSQLAAAGFQESLARSAYYPDLSFSFYRHRVDGEPNSWDIALGISVPIFGLGAISGQVAEARAEKTALDAEQAAAHARVELQVLTAHRALEDLGRQVGRYRQSILTPAEEAFSLASASYSEGEIESLELLDSRRTLQEVRQAFAESVFEYNLALIDLEQAVGSELGWEMPAEPSSPLASGEEE
jgi:outer membrane protein TolC